MVNPKLHQDFNPFSVVTVFIGQILISKDGPRTERGNIIIMSHRLNLQEIKKAYNGES